MEPAEQPAVVSLPASSLWALLIAYQSDLLKDALVAEEDENSVKHRPPLGTGIGPNRKRIRK